MKIHQSAEDYLETILLLKEKTGNVRSIDIVNHLNFSKASVSVAMKNFRENGYITMDENGYINLTETGFAIADKTYERHKILTKFLMKIGVSEAAAKEDACKIEHNLSEETFDRLKEHYEKFSD